MGTVMRPADKIQICIGIAILIAMIIITAVDIVGGLVSPAHCDDVVISGIIIDGSVVAEVHSVSGTDIGKVQVSPDIILTVDTEAAGGKIIYCYKSGAISGRPLSKKLRVVTSQ